MKKSPWYKDGLRFSCTECGKCCYGFPGYVWLSPQEIIKIATFLQIDEQTFIKKFTKAVFRRLSLKEKGDNYACIFFQDGKCSIYPVRPKQCKTYPFWPEIVENEQTWEEEKKFCEGIDHIDGKLISEEEITSLL